MSPSLAAVRSRATQAEFSFATDDKPHALMMAAQALVGPTRQGPADQCRRPSRGDGERLWRERHWRALALEGRL